MTGSLSVKELFALLKYNHKQLLTKPKDSLKMLILAKEGWGGQRRSYEVSGSVRAVEPTIITH
ncbi:hypothetical protein N7475_010430 [Penicillium sp. IBT 31633x]|nr:hypothetical protein N7475_010430 [Penicillium sp. IBT 31633x]